MQSILTLSQAKASCKLRETVCGIAGREDSLAFECIDTTLTQDSCTFSPTLFAFSVDFMQAAVA
jgi:hypothetical protein